MYVCRGGVRVRLGGVCARARVSWEGSLGGAVSRRIACKRVIEEVARRLSESSSSIMATEAMDVGANVGDTVQDGAEDVPGSATATAAPPFWHMLSAGMRKGVHTVSHLVNDIHPETGEYEKGLASHLEEYALLICGFLLFVYFVGVYSTKQSRTEAMKRRYGKSI